LDIEVPRFPQPMIAILISFSMRRFQCFRFDVQR